MKSIFQHIITRQKLQTYEKSLSNYQKQKHISTKNNIYKRNINENAIFYDIKF